jgi:cytochrome c oxidase cbb3-type subunit 3
MSSHCRDAAMPPLVRVAGSVLLFLTALVGISCQREDRYRVIAAKVPVVDEKPRMSELVPGGSPQPPPAINPYDANAYAISQGQTLYNWFNCAGCHAPHGGGGMGPPLNDDAWIYGSQPQQIFDSILRGRPNGMPVWAGKIPQHQIWQLVVYVQSLAGNQPKPATPARSDSIEPNPSNLLNRPGRPPR